MAFGCEVSEKLTHLMVATAICGTTVAVAPSAGLLALVESLLGGAAVAHYVLHRRFAKADAVLRRCTAQVEAGSGSWIDSEFRDEPGTRIRHDEAIAALRDVVPLIVPKADELVAARLDESRITAFYLDRASRARPDIFADTEQNAIARRLFQAVIGKAYRLVLAQPEFAAEMQQHTLAELLQGQDGIRDDLGRLPDTIVAKLVAALDARGDTRRTKTAGLERRAIIALAGRLRPEEVLDFDQAIVELERLVKVAIDVTARGNRGTNFDNFADRVLARVAAKTRAGDFDGAARDVDQALVEFERQEAERRRLAWHSRIALLEAGVEQGMLKRDAAGVARRIEAVVAAEQPSGRPAWAPAFRERYDHYYKEGNERGSNFSLSVAIEIARRMAMSARNRDERAHASELAGNALVRLGERESGTARLEEAVVAYRAALEEMIRKRVPLDWAMTQNNLGHALTRLGQRESCTARLGEAVAAYRAALEERTRERVPLDWATTQNNLGNALTTLGERESGTARLEEAVAAHRAALEEWTRERVPLDWATTQNNLGNALARLGERESGTARLEEAVAAYRAALEERTRERVPLQWATTQNNLGNALTRLGQRESGTARLEEAVAAHRAALEERMRERVPLDWATTQNNLGHALTTLGQRESGTARLEEAVAAHRAALEERMRERVPLQWAMTQNNLGHALTRLGERESGTARLEEAVAAFDAALAVFVEAHAEFYAHECRDNRDRAVSLITERKR